MSKQISFYMGYNCNLRCKYCNLEKDDFTHKHIINSEKEFTTVIDKLIDRGIMDTIDRILISGGEPTLFESEVTKILEKYSNKYRIIIISNGLKLDVLKRWYKFNTEFIISYDGHINDRGFDSFDTLKELYKDSKLHGVSLVVSNANYPYLLETIDELYELFPDVMSRDSSAGNYRGLDSILVHRESDFYKIDYDLFYKVMKSVYRKYPKFKIFMNQNGNNLCENFFEYSNTLLCSHNSGEILSGGCLGRIPEEEREDFLKMYSSKCDKCQSTTCFARSCPYVSYVLNVKIDEEHAYCKLNEIIDRVKKEVNNELYMMERLKNISNYELILTNSCNMSCKYCFQKGLHRETLISDETLRNFIELIKRGKQKKLITLFGGEPIQSKTLDSRYKLINLIKENELEDDVTLFIVSNTFVITDKDKEWIKYAYNTLKGKFYWQVSLDGLEEYNDSNRVTKTGEGTFKYVIKNLKEISKIIGFDRTCMNSVINGNNIPGLPYWIKYINDELYMKYISPNGLMFRFDQSRKEAASEEELENLRKSLKEVYNLYKAGELNHRLVKKLFSQHKASYESDLTTKKENESSCGMCINNIVVETNGDLIPCHVFEKEDNVVLSNINTGYINDDIENIFDLYGSIADTYSNYKKDYCYKCEFKLTCARCKYEQLKLNGDINQVLDYPCSITVCMGEIYKEFFYEEFKPFTDEEKKEIEEVLLSIDESMMVNEDIQRLVLKLKEEMEVKEWYS